MHDGASAGDGKYIIMRQPHRHSRAIITGIVILAFSAPTAAFCQVEDVPPLLDRAVEYQAGRTNQAAQLLVRLLQDNRDNPKAHYFLGCALKKMGRGSQGQ